MFLLPPREACPYQILATVSLAPPLPLRFVVKRRGSVIDRWIEYQESLDKEEIGQRACSVTAGLTKPMGDQDDPYTAIEPSGESQPTLCPGPRISRISRAYAIWNLPSPKGHRGDTRGASRHFTRSQHCWSNPHHTLEAPPRMKACARVQVWVCGEWRQILPQRRWELRTSARSRT